MMSLFLQQVSHTTLKVNLKRWSLKVTPSISIIKMKISVVYLAAISFASLAFAVPLSFNADGLSQRYVTTIPRNGSTNHSLQHRSLDDEGSILESLQVRTGGLKPALCIVSVTLANIVYRGGITSHRELSTVLKCRDTTDLGMMTINFFVKLITLSLSMTQITG